MLGGGQDELLFLLPKLGSLLAPAVQCHDACDFFLGVFFLHCLFLMCLPKDLDRYLMELLVDGRKPPELHKVERKQNSTGLQCIWLLIWGVERHIFWTFTSMSKN